MQMISKYIFLTWTTSLNYIFFNSLIHIYTSIFDISKSTTEPPSSLFLQSAPFQLNCSILPVAWAKTNKKKTTWSHPSYLTFHIPSVSQCDWLLLQNIPRIQPLLLIFTTITWTKPTSFLTWITAVTISN